MQAPVRSSQTPRRLQSASSFVPACVSETERATEPEVIVSDPDPTVSMGRLPNSDLNSISIDCPDVEHAVVPELR